jgi:hypothetical protein
MARPIKQLVLTGITVFTLGAGVSFIGTGTASATDGHHNDWQAHHQNREHEQTWNNHDSNNSEARKVEDHSWKQEDSTYNASHHEQKASHENVSWKQEHHQATNAKHEQSYDRSDNHQDYTHHKQASTHEQTWKEKEDCDNDANKQSSHHDSWKQSHHEQDNYKEHKQADYDKSWKHNEHENAPAKHASYHESDNSWKHHENREHDYKKASYHHSDYKQEKLEDEYEMTLREHAALAGPLLKAELMKDADLHAIKTAVEKNNHAIAKAIEQGYPGTYDEFLPLWESHIDYYNQYLYGAKLHKEEKKENAKENLDKFVKHTTKLLSKASHDLDRKALRHSLSMHGAQTTTFIDHLVAKDYDAAYTIAHKAYVHMGDIARILAAGSSGRA